jgi:hypothetical protein
MNLRNESIKITKKRGGLLVPSNDEKSLRIYLLSVNIYPFQSTPLLAETTNDFLTG